MSSKGKLLRDTSCLHGRLLCHSAACAGEETRQPQVVPPRGVALPSIPAQVGLQVHLRVHMHVSLKLEHSRQLLHGAVPVQDEEMRPADSLPEASADQHL